LEGQLKEADAVFLVLDYNSVNSSVDMGHQLLGGLEAVDRLHVVVNKVEDTSLIKNHDTKQATMKRVRERLASCGLGVPASQVRAFLRDTACLHH
jgi:nicotinamide mononucleotide adenylyltransferase